MAAAGLPSPAASKLYVTQLMQSTAAELSGLAARPDPAVAASEVAIDPKGADL